VDFLKLGVFWILANKEPLLNALHHVFNCKFLFYTVSSLVKVLFHKVFFF